VQKSTVNTSIVTRCDDDDEDVEEEEKRLKNGSDRPNAPEVRVLAEIMVGEAVVVVCDSSQPEVDADDKVEVVGEGRTVQVNVADRNSSDCSCSAVHVLHVVRSLGIPQPTQ
jgi:hypothetical protein